jgi:hypothetical protein
VGNKLALERVGGCMRRGLPERQLRGIAVETGQNAHQTTVAYKNEI